jgi:hypothetical protein
MPARWVQFAAAAVAFGLALACGLPNHSGALSSSRRAEVCPQGGLSLAVLALSFNKACSCRAVSCACGLPDHSGALSSSRRAEVCPQGGLSLAVLALSFNKACSCLAVSCACGLPDHSGALNSSRRVETHSQGKHIHLRAAICHWRLDCRWCSHALCTFCRPSSHGAQFARHWWRPLLLLRTRCRWLQQPSH